MGSKNLRLAELASNVDVSGAYTQSAGITVYNTSTQLPIVGNETGDLAFIDSSDKLYIYSGEGWYNIGIINQTPRITTGPDASYKVEPGTSPIVLTLIAEDAENNPITWGYSVTAGSIDSSATVEQVDNVFTITPNSDSATPPNGFSITFTASDGNSLATAVSTFTIAFTHPISPLQGTYIATEGALSGTLQENGDYRLVGNAPSLATGGQIYTQPFTEKTYFEIVLTSFDIGMMGFHTTATSNYNLNDGTNGFIYFNGNHYKVGSTITSTGVGAWGSGDVLQFAIDPSTRTMYYSKNDSATIYSHTLAVGDGQIWFTFGSGTGSTAYDITLRNPANLQYHSSFVTKTGIQFTNIGVWAE